MKNKKAIEFVDLGLPSGVKWATCNLGAEAPYEVGNYYMWGSTTKGGDDICGKSAYKDMEVNEIIFGIPGDYSMYDTALNETNELCRMPSRGDISELMEYTIQEWCTYDEENKVEGMRFTSKTNGNSIFVPNSGYRNEDYIYNNGHKAYLWSSSVYDNDSAWGLYANDTYCDFSLNSRYFGQCIRPVQNKKKKLYLSGPMSLCKDEETWRRNFQKYEDIFTAMGYDVVNPAKNEILSTYEECLKHSLKQEMDCDCIFFMENAILSTGARLEYEIASACGLDIVVLDDDISMTDNYQNNSGIKSKNA